jgi:hypothetical protein
LATLYHGDGKTPFPYWNILLRPAGSINASAKDMAAYVQFYLNRGAVGGVQVAPAASIDRMETPTRAWEAQEGLKAGYGLSNYTSIREGFVYHGHDGGVNGGITDMSYMPEYGVGYFYSINSDNGGAFGKIGDAIRAYITRSLTKPPVPAAGQLPANAADYTGFYIPAAPRSEMTHFLSNELGLIRVRFEGRKLLLTSMGQLDQPFDPVSGAQFRFVPKKGPPEPIATAMLLRPNAEGRFVYLGSAMQRIPTGLAILQIALTVWFVLALLAIIVYAPFWLIGGFFRKRRRPAERAMRLWPLIAVLSLVAFVALFIVSNNDGIQRLGNLTVYSFGLCATTVLFALASVASAISLWLARKQEIRGVVRWFSILATTGLLIATAYLAYWGVIGIRTWS